MVPAKQGVYAIINHENLSQKASVCFVSFKGLRGNILCMSVWPCEVFNWLRTKDMSIYMLQEVHCCAATSDLRASE